LCLLSCVFGKCGPIPAITSAAFARRSPRTASKCNEGVTVDRRAKPSSPSPAELTLSVRFWRRAVRAWATATSSCSWCKYVRTYTYTHNIFTEHAATRNYDAQVRPVLYIIIATKITPVFLNFKKYKIHDRLESYEKNIESNEY
jgi:hypothetical protein